jgi:hypothetical protein
MDDLTNSLWCKEYKNKGNSNYQYSALGAGSSTDTKRDEHREYSRQIATKSMSCRIFDSSLQDRPDLCGKLCVP